MNRALLWLVKLVVAVVGLAALAILCLALMHHRPALSTPVAIEGQGYGVEAPRQLRLVTWNLGYAGLGSEADFFMDGGKGVLPQDSEVLAGHLGDIVAQLQRTPAEVYLLQEVDTDSHRSYRIDERRAIATALPEFYRSYALNYDVTYVPYPLTQPTGAVKSGVMSLSRHKPASATRIQLPGAVQWPISAFVLDRCALVWQLPADGGKRWVLINVHLSAYDSGGALRKTQLAFLKQFVTEQYAGGNFVVVGGDWNSILPGTRPDQFPSRGKATDYYIPLPEDFTPVGWHWAVPSAPTNRVNDSPYEAGRNYVTVIDGFLVSPNVDVNSIQTLQLGFRDSDHNPVVVKLTAR